MKKYMCLFLSMLMILSLVPMTVGAAGESWSSFVFSQDGPEFSFKATDFTGTDSYTFYAAAYSNNNELLDVKVASSLEASDGVLSATVDFEEGGTKEADVNISYVKTMVWGDEYRPIVKSHTFDIEEQKIDSNTGVYNNLTNGFYKQANVAGNAPLGSNYNIVWIDANAVCSARNTESANKHDSNPGTMSDNIGAISDKYARMQYLTFFSNNKFQIDRLVAYVPATTDGSFYLIDNDKVNYSDTNYANKFNKDETNTDGIKFVGNRETENCVSNTRSNINGWLVDRLVFDTDYYCRAMVFDAEPGEKYSYAVNEFLPYVKVKDSHSVAMKPATITGDLTVSMDGPIFTMSGTNFTTDRANLKFTATAYNSADEQVDQVESEFSITANESTSFSQTVDFEAGKKEADVSIDKVITELKDGYGNVLATVTFDDEITPQAVSDSVYNNLTNGFYAPIITLDSPISSNYWQLWTDVNSTSAQATASEISKLYDNRLDTDARGKNTAVGSEYAKMQYILFMSNPNKQIDRVVVYLPSDNNGSFYLGKNDSESGVADAFYERGNAGYATIFKGAETNNYYKKYVGNIANGISNDAVSSSLVTVGSTELRKLVFDTDYEGRMMIFDTSPAEGGKYGVNEYQIYRKVTAEPKTMTITAN